MNGIEALSEWLGSLQIINEILDKTIEQSDEAIYVALVIMNMNK